MKQCTKCKATKAKNEFSTDSKTRDKLQSWCKSCRNEHSKEYHQTPKSKRQRKEYQKTPKYKEINKNGRYKRKYGITIEEYNKIFQDQDGRCAICGTDIPGGMGRFHVDHNYINGKIRGLLCNSCNPALGLFKDDVDILTNAIRYLNLNNE